MKHIVFYSGGICSWATAKRVISKNGKENVILLFADTKTEDEDLYRFLNDTKKAFDVELIKISEGRNVWEVFKDGKFLGNSKIAPSSRILKQQVSKKWVTKNFKPDECILYLGIDWTEIHRVESPKKNWFPYKVEFPMTEEPYLSKNDMFEMVISCGIKIPRLYEMGFSHNNCGGFCVKAGQAHFINLLKKIPERYKFHEEKEQEIRNFLKKDVSILRKTVNGERKNITLKELREEFEVKPQSIDMFDVGGCGCFANEEEENLGV